SVYKLQQCREKAFFFLLPPLLHCTAVWCKYADLLCPVSPPVSSPSSARIPYSIDPVVPLPLVNSLLLLCLSPRQGWTTAARVCVWREGEEGGPPYITQPSKDTLLGRHSPDTT